MSIGSPLNINEKLYALVDSPLKYAFKSHDMDLYQLGFGDTLICETWKGKQVEICTYAIHCTCAIFFYWKNGKLEKFNQDSSPDEFHTAISQLFGMRVQRVATSPKNDLWIDLDICNIVIVTREDEFESWRFFLPRSDQPHLVATSRELVVEAL